MRKNYKMIKTVILFSVLSCCWHSGTTAMEEIEGQGGMKRSATQAGHFRREESDCYLINFPLETTRHLLTFLDPNKDENTLLSLRSCTKSDSWEMQKLIEEKYAETNKKEHVYQWQDSLPLTDRNLYAFNKRLRIILGFYNNLSGYHNMAGGTDRIWFEKLCSQFEKCSFFSETAIPVMYVKMLRLDLDYKMPSPLVNLLSPQLDEKKQNLAQKFREVVKQKDSKNQNEGALCLHFCQFVLNIPFQQLTGLQSTPFSGKLDGSFMRVMGQELLALKLTPFLSNAGHFGGIWEEIIDLEPRATIFQLNAAACSYFSAGENAPVPVIKFEYFTKSAKYYEEQLNAIINAGQSPTVNHYDNIANACLKAGLHATDPLVKFEYFTKSIKFHEEELKAIRNAGQSPTAINYDNIALVCYEAGNNATDPVIKFENFTKSVKYHEEQLKVIRNAGQSPTVPDYFNITNACLKAGLHATDPLVKFEYFTKSVKYHEEGLKAIRNAGQSPTEINYSNIALVFYQAGLNATDPVVKLENFTKSAKYRKEQLNAIRNAGQSPTAVDCANIANACFQAGLNATDPVVKLDNFARSVWYYVEQLCAFRNAGQHPTAGNYNNIAVACYYVGLNTLDSVVKSNNYTNAQHYFKLALDEGMQGDGAQKIHEYLTQISSYFGELEKAAHHDISEDMQCDG